MSDYDSDALAGFDEWFGQILAGLTPAKRKAAARQLGQALRRANLARITRNVQPDGKAMETRKPRPGSRKDKRGRLRKKAGGKMFRKLRLAKSWRIDAQPDSVELRPVNPLVGHTAATHHFGLRGFVGKASGGRTIKTRYPERHLLGFAPEDEQAALDVAIAMINSR